jgi:hypothetical protein
MTRHSAALLRHDPANDAIAYPYASAAQAEAAGHQRSIRRQQQPVAIIKIARLWPGAERAAEATAPVRVPAVGVKYADMRLDSLDSFQSESAGPVPTGVRARQENRGRPPRPPLNLPWLWSTLRWASVLVLSAGAAVSGVWAYQRQQGPETGTLTIQTSPAGLPVEINSRASGVTPLTLTLAPAAYSVHVGTGAQRRDLTVTVTAGSSVLQHLELPAAAASVAVTTGALRVQTDPPGQAVTVDGLERGVAPMTIEALPSGEHTVSVRGPAGTVRKSVTVKAGETVSLVVSPIAPVVAAPGWLSVQSSARLELREAGKLIGTTETEQIMLPAGEHTIELVNDAIGYRSQRTIDVGPGKTTVVPIELPFGAVSINALPWAEVWINGDRVGETPIANLARRVGSYEIVFRHPELGEKRETITITLRQTARIGVDMRGKQP